MSLYPIYKMSAQFLTHLPTSIRKWTMKQAIRYILRRFANITIEGDEEQLAWAKQNPCIFVCNHLSNADGLLLNQIFAERYQLDVKFIAGVKLQDSLFSSLALETIPHIAIHPETPDRQAIKEAVKAVKNGSSILIFPEGGRSRHGQLIEGKKGVMLIQKMCKAPILPIALYGSENMMPINDDDMNMESFHRAKIVVRIGTPYTPQAGASDDIEFLMRQIAQLLPVEYQGVYKNESL